MYKKIVQFIFYILIISFIFTLEKKYGLPVLSVALVAILSSALNGVFRFCWIAIVGVLWASFFQWPFASGLIFVACLYGLWQVSGLLFKNLNVRWGLTTGVGVLGVLIWGGIIVTSLLWLQVFISLLVMILLSHFVLFLPEGQNSRDVLDLSRNLK